MAAKSPVTDPDAIEREIVAALRAAKLRPRFDKVALRVVGRLKAALASVVPEGETVIFTISAPIRLPGETAAALETMARSGSREALRREVIHGAAVRIRRLEGAAKPMPRVLAFVHSDPSDAEAILALAEARLLRPNGER